MAAWVARRLPFGESLDFANVQQPVSGRRQQRPEEWSRDENPQFGPCFSPEQDRRSEASRRIDRSPRQADAENMYKRERQADNQPGDSAVAGLTGKF